MTDQTVKLRDFRLPLIVTLLFITWVVMFHASMLPLGDISHNDESLTLDRTTSFILKEDWLNVYTHNEVNFNKPPLQYWMSALLLERGVDITQALRIPSFVFGVLCLFATALFSYSLFPTLPWAIPVSVLFVSSSDRFWESATMAMLDTGALLFITLALAGINLALKNPKWWYLVGFSIAVGALQKAPIALAFVGAYLFFLAITSPWHGHRIKDVFLNRHLWLSLALGLLFAFSWHIWQFVQHGNIAIRQGIGREMVGRVAPTGATDSVKSVREVASHMFGAEAAIRFFGLIAVFAVPFRFKRYDLLPIPLIFTAYMIGFAYAGGHVSNRYTMMFVILVAVLLAAAILKFSYSLQTKAMIIFLMSIFSGGPAKPPSELKIFPPSYMATQIEILSELAANPALDRPLFVCNWHRSERIIPGYITYYGAGGRTHTRVEFLERLPAVFEQGRVSGPFEGVCRSEDLATLDPYIQDIEIITEIEPYVHFRANSREEI